jgi:uncharacterized membrane protein YdjX (TVP38/TMEM64 family)
MQQKAFLADWRRRIRWGLVLLLAAALLILSRFVPLEQAFRALQDWIAGQGIWGAVALGVIYVVAALLLIPGSLISLVAGAVYGTVRGTILVSIASTTTAALAFLIARYVARDAVRRAVARSPKFAAVDEAIGAQGWKIVALLRLSPAVPFNLQNYLYGVTAIRFWPCVLVSWAAMLPGTVMYVYIGSLGGTAAQREASLAEWALRGVGLLATVAVTVYLGRLAQNAIRKQTKIEQDSQCSQSTNSGHSKQ